MKRILSALLCVTAFWSSAASSLRFDKPDYSRKKEMNHALSQGDFSVLDQAAKDGEAGVLWHYVQAISTSPMFASENDTKVLKRAKELLTSLPGHTQNIIDTIEKKAELTKNVFKPNSAQLAGFDKQPETEEEVRIQEALFETALTTAGTEFIHLQKLGSPECVQTLMTYLDDERRIGADSAGSLGEILPASSNQWRAIDGLCSVLRGENPAQAEFNTGGRDLNTAAIVQCFKDWWLSDASKKWRTPVVKTTRSHLLPGGSKGPETAPAPAWALETFQRDALWPILLILCLAALAAVLGFTKLRRH